MDKLTGGERIILAAAAVLVIDLVMLPWHLVESITPVGRGVDEDITAVQSPLGVLGVLAALLAVVMIVQIVVAKFTTTKLPELPVPWSQVHLVAGFAILGILLVKAILEPDDLGLGCYAGIVSAVVLAYGGWVVNGEAASPTGRRDAGAGSPPGLDSPRRQRGGS